MPQNQGSVNFKRAFVMGFLAVVVVLIAAGIGYGFYATRQLSTHRATMKFADVFGVSAARVNAVGIPYTDYVTELGVIKKFYASSAAGLSAPTEEQMSDQVLGNLLINTLIAQVAKTYDVAVTQTDIEASSAYQGILARFGGDVSAVENDLAAQYGLSFSEYADKAIRPVLLEQKLREVFEASSDESTTAYAEEQRRASHILFQVSDSTDAKALAAAKKQAQAVLVRVKSGEDFAALAKEFGSDGTRDTGGDLGWFGSGRMVKEFEEAVWATPAETLAPDLVKTNFGWHILKVTGSRIGRNYSKFMADKIKEARVQILLPIHNPFEAIKAQIDAEANVNPVSSGSNNQ